MKQPLLLIIYCLRQPYPLHTPHIPMESTDVELDLQRSVQAVLRELSAQGPALQSNQGMWRWSLHKKVERDPGKSPALIRILLGELEKAESEDVRHVIVPLLHTLMYELMKATGITEELYQRTYTFCKRLLTLPTPYSTVALDCAIRLKTEMAVPGALYQRLVIAEQNLESELYPYQERVFLFVDPELVSPSVCSALLLEIEAAQAQQTPEVCMRHVVSHALQAALGENCHSGALQRKLQVSALPDLTRTSPQPCIATSLLPNMLLLLFPYHLFPRIENTHTYLLKNLKEIQDGHRRK